MAILVSLQVSFLLLRVGGGLLAGDAKKPQIHMVPPHRAGFYGVIDRVYKNYSTSSCDFEYRWRFLPFSSSCLPVPLYQMVKQDFIPSNIDEAQFSVSLSGPEEPVSRQWMRH
ncbi:MAG: hypothetical protein IPJ07_26805 [Acidobacteria bacterium]|nr:hypothetical protein [Acidobacteriota bacterium]